MKADTIDVVEVVVNAINANGGFAHVQGDRLYIEAALGGEPTIIPTAALRETLRSAGYVVVPRNCDVGSPAMLVAGKNALYGCSEDPELEDARKCWNAMIAAAEGGE